MRLRHVRPLLTRWDLIAEVSPADAAQIVGSMVRRIETDAASGALARYSPSIEVLATRLSPESADSLIRRAFARGSA